MGLLDRFGRIADTYISERDALGIEGCKDVNIEANDNCTLLLMEVPMIESPY